MSRFDSFVMLAGMRTGSNFLEANLNALPGVRCLGELFNPHFIGARGALSLLGWDLRRREADPMGFLAHVRAETPGLSGFRYFHDHDPRVLDPLLQDRRCAKIVLGRNPLESYVSLQIARETDQWKLTDARRRRQARVHFDPAGFEAHLDAAQAFQLHILRRLQSGGQTAFWLDYEDLAELEVLNGLARFLGSEARLDAPDASLKKQNPEPIAEKVANPEAIGTALARIDRFNLSRTPCFEPRRGPAVPGFLAAGPLLWLPIRGGPEAAVKDWLASVGPLEGEFTQKTLRQWKRAHPGHRAFAVLRHPLARAHAGFRDRILTGALAEIRAGLNRVHGLGLPPVDEVAAMDEAAFRAAFLRFLGFLKLNLAGQTGLRVAAEFASQQAVVQGMAPVQVPDAVLREERLAEGLAFLAAETGLPTPPAPPNHEDRGPHPLAAIWGDDLEQAARDAYGRDYAAFGFGRWKA